jgi:hypothetical protein
MKRDWLGAKLASYGLYTRLTTRLPVIRPEQQIVLASWRQINS